MNVELFIKKNDLIIAEQGSIEKRIQEIREKWNDVSQEERIAFAEEKRRLQSRQQVLFEYQTTLTKAFLNR